MKINDKQNKEISSNTKRETINVEKLDEKQSPIELNYNKQQGGKRNKEYDSLQIDFEHKNNQYFNNYKSCMNRTFELKNGNGFNNYI